MQGRILLIVIVVMVAAAGPARSQTPDDRVQKLESRVASLEAELKKYRDASPDKQAMDLAALERTLAEVNARLSTGNAGYSNGFFIANNDKTFQAKLNGFVQIRALYNQNDSSTGDNDEFGFQMRRAELYLNGNMFGPEIFYHVSGGFDRASGTFGLVAAYAGYQFNKQWDFRTGSFKAPFTVEELISAGKQQAMERSLLNSVFSAGTVDGAQIQYSGETLRLAMAVHDGTNSMATDFQLDRTDAAFAARAEWKLAGKWTQFGDFHGWSDDTFAARLGAAVDYEAGESGDAGLNPDMFKYTVDFMAKAPHWNVFIALAGRHVEDDGSAGSDVDQFGVLVQAGRFIVANRLEVFGRYEYIELDGFLGTTPTIDDELNIVTLGVNWFLHGHNAKVSADVSYLFDSVPSNNTTLGILASDDGPQVIARAAMIVNF